MHCTMLCTFALHLHCICNAKVMQNGMQNGMQNLCKTLCKIYALVQCIYFIYLFIYLFLYLYMYTVHCTLKAKIFSPGGKKAKTNFVSSAKRKYPNFAFKSPLLRFLGRRSIFIPPSQKNPLKAVYCVFFEYSKKC